MGFYELYWNVSNIEVLWFNKIFTYLSLRNFLLFLSFITYTHIHVIYIHIHILIYIFYFTYININNYRIHLLDIVYSRNMLSYQIMSKIFRVFPISEMNGKSGIHIHIWNPYLRVTPNPGFIITLMYHLVNYSYSLGECIMCSSLFEIKFLGNNFYSKSVFNKKLCIYIWKLLTLSCLIWVYKSINR